MGLRIFTAVRHSLDPRQFYGDLWRDNFRPALRQLGHTVVESKVDLAPASRFMQVAREFTPEEHRTRDRITEQVLGEIKQARAAGGLDLVLTYFYNSHFNPAGFAEIRRLGIPSINFYCNSIYQFELVAEMARAADHAWHTERDAHEKYCSIGANPVWVQIGADPELYRPHPGVCRSPRACFVGQRYADRDRLVIDLIRQQVPLDLYGSGWTPLAGNGNAPPPASGHPTSGYPASGYPASGRPAADGASAGTYLGRAVHRPGSMAAYLAVAGQRIWRDGPLFGLARVVRQFNYCRDSRKLSPLLADHAKGVAGDISDTFARYDVVLNFSNVWADGSPGSPLVPHVRLRDFEAPMCRACYLTGYTDEIGEFYDLGREIDTYRCPAELVEKAKFYLARPDAAEGLREAGYRRALRDHTWVRRFEELFRKIGLEAR